MIQLNNFDSQLLKISKRENRENNPEHDLNSINNLYLVVDHMCGKIQKIDI